MIKIEILKDKKKRIISFSSKGHSFYKKKGEDIVCAAVSAILQTTILGLSNLNLILEVEKREGLLNVKLLSPLSCCATSILETMKLGLSEIAKKYPDNIEVIEK